MQEVKRRLFIDLTPFNPLWVLIVAVTLTPRRVFDLCPLSLKGEGGEF